MDNQNNIRESETALCLSNKRMEAVFSKTADSFYLEKLTDRETKQSYTVGHKDLNWFCFAAENEIFSPRSVEVCYGGCEQIPLKNGGIHFKIRLHLRENGVTRIRMLYHLQMFADCAMTRHRLELCPPEGQEFCLSYRQGLPVWTFPAFSLQGNPTPDVQVISLAEWNGNQQEHSYSPRSIDFGSAAEVEQKGPVLSAFYPQTQTGFLLCYEHGSPDTPGEDYYHVRFSQGEACHSLAVLSENPGVYLEGERVTDTVHYKSPWVDFGGYGGAGHDDGLKMLWQFLLTGISEQKSLRQPCLYYNTWAVQRKDQMQGGSLTDRMTEPELLKMLDLVHELGIDVFVIDAYWYDRFGDWNPSPERLPHGLKPILSRAESYGMRVGLWFEPTTASVDSKIVQEHPEWIQTDRFGRPIERNCWDQRGYRMCLSSGYREYFTDVCKRFLDEGVSYIKWDALDPTECCSPKHAHGDFRHSPDSRRARARCRYIEELTRIARDLNVYAPELIIEFDVTEADRAVGLSFFSQGRYYWTNNGVFDYGDYGEGRTVTGRKMVYEYGRMIPPVLFNHAQYPNDGLKNGKNAVLSSLLGPLGLWGDFAELTEQERQMTKDLIAQYKQIRDEIVLCRPEISGKLGEEGETYGFSDPISGCGMRIVFHPGRSGDIEFSFR